MWQLVKWSYAFIEDGTIGKYNTTKPSKYHIKSLGLCGNNNGYAVNVFTYYRSEAGYHPDFD